MRPSIDGFLAVDSERDVEGFMFTSFVSVESELVDAFFWSNEDVLFQIESFAQVNDFFFKMNDRFVFAGRRGFLDGEADYTVRIRRPFIIHTIFENLLIYFLSNFQFYFLPM